MIYYVLPPRAFQGKEAKADIFFSVEMHSVLVGCGYAIRAWVLEVSFKRQY